MEAGLEAVRAAARPEAAGGSLLALVSLASSREFALAMVIGVAIEAFVVRTFLGPAPLRPFGETSSWPGGFRARPAAEPVG